MSVRVYQFGLLAPTEGEADVRSQLRASHEYANDLIAIERGRRAAIREIHAESEAVREAESLLKAATRSTRNAARKALAQARRQAERDLPDDMASIAALDKSVRRDARALTTSWWGSYLTIEASHDQLRKSRLYDGLEPVVPRFRRRNRLGDDTYAEGDARHDWWLSDGQIGIHVQNRTLSTAEVLRCEDSYVRVELLPDRRGSTGYPRYGVLWLRVGTDGREPRWARWPMKLHRPIPDGASWKWVRVSCRREALREQWSCEITVELPAAETRVPEGVGAVAVEVCWEQTEDTIRVARYLDEWGERGELLLPPRLSKALAHGAGIRAVRDIMTNDLRKQLVRSVSGVTLPAWLRTELATVAIWRSHWRFHRLFARWRRDCPAVAAEAFSLLAAWYEREKHLYQYEDCERAQAVRSRREFYRVQAARWAERYHTIILDGRDLSREARWGAESAVRFLAGTSVLRAALGHAIAAKMTVEHVEDGWLEQAIERYRADQPPGGARNTEISQKDAPLRGGAWGRRKTRKLQGDQNLVGARKPVPNDAE